MLAWAHLIICKKVVVVGYKGGVAGLLADGTAEEQLGNVGNEEAVRHLLVGAHALYGKGSSHCRRSTTAEVLAR